MKKHHALFSRTIPAIDGLYDYSSPECREQTVEALLDNCALSRQRTELYWKKMRRYYDGVHDINYISGSFCEDMNLPWTPAQSSDGYVHVESQIDPNIPDFEFSPLGRYSAVAAKQREDTVRRICDVNGIAEKNASNERRLNIYGSAVWKIGWGESSYAGTKRADVIIEAPMPEQIYIDPAALSVDASEYIAFVYRMHNQRAFRLFADDIKARGESFNDYLDSSGGGVVYEDAYEDDNTVVITEFWFRQPVSGTVSGTRFNAGDIALCVLINGKEVKYIPKYWINTDCAMYPFVIYNKVPNDGSIWGKSELEQLIPLIDAADRELTFAQLNAAFCSNDVILAEENAFSDGETPDNSPDAVWKLRPGMMGKVQRLGNLSSTQVSQFNNHTLWQNLMEQTTGNFEVNQGKEPARVTTASGIALMNERAKSRQTLKKAGRTEGFKRLYSLIDYTALEFYEKGRFVERGADGFEFDPDSYRSGELSGTFPAVDIRIHVGDGLNNSKAFTVSAVSSLIGTAITEDNYKFVKAYVDLIGLPMRNEICEYLENKFSPAKNTDGKDILDEIVNDIRKSESEETSDTEQKVQNPFEAPVINL